MLAVVDARRADTFLRALGDELRQARRRRGWTRKDLLTRLGLDISVQTIATYELGTRPCTVVRLLDFAETLEVSMLDMLSRALERVANEDDMAARLSIDLVTVARTRRAKLGPLRRWAQSRLNSIPEGQSTLVRLNLPALEQLAEVCGMSTVELIAELRR